MPNKAGTEKVRKQSQFKEVFHRLAKNKLAITGLVIFAFFVLIAIFAPLISPYSYRDMVVADINAAPSLKHPFGCDDLGRDILSRLLYGARWSIGLGLSASAFGIILGIFFGCIAGYFGGKVEDIIMRICDIFQALPGILLSIVISTAFGSGFIFTIIALGVGRITHVCRMIRAQFLSISDQEFVEAAKALNVPRWKIVLKHILPNAVSPLIVSATMGIGGTIMNAAGLSYLGLGIQPPTPEWGAMLSASRQYMRYYPWQVLFPGLCIAIFVLAMNLLGDGLRDAMDPKLKN